MSTLLLFLILLVLFAACFPMCALMLGVGGGLTLVEFWDRYWWLVLVAALLVVSGRIVQQPMPGIGYALGRLVRRLRAWVS